MKKHAEYCKDSRCPGGRFPAGLWICSYWKEVARIEKGEHNEKNKQRRRKGVT